MNGVMPNGKVELCDLPDDILLEIINEHLLSLTDLYCLATLSRHLQGIALPVYLRAHGLSHPQQKCTIHLEHSRSTNSNPVYGTPTLDGLSGLAIMTNLKSIDHLICNIPTSGYKFTTLVNDKISQLLRVIDRLDSVLTVEIDLKGILFRYNYFNISDSRLQAWTTHLATLLNTVVEKGCTTLTVNGSLMKDAYYFQVERQPSVKPFMKLVNFVMRSFKASNTCLQGPYCEYRWPLLAGYSGRIEIQPSQDNFKKCQLRSFAIHSGLLLVPPHLNWTISLLHFCTSITSISFGNIGMQSARWRAMLLCVAAALSGRLREVSFSLCWGLRLGDVLEFLSRTPRLTRIEMPSPHSFTMPREIEHPEKSSLVIPSLPRLEVLDVPFVMMNYLLRSPRFRLFMTPPLPNLRNWTTRLSGPGIFDNYQYIEECTTRHSAFRQRLLSRKEIKYDPEFCICIALLQTDYVSALDADRGRVSEAIASQLIPAFKQVTCVVIEGISWAKGILFTMIPLLFPDLRELKLVPSILDERRHRGDGQDERNLTPAIGEVLSDLRRACPKLGRVVTERYIFDLPGDGSPITMCSL